MLELLSGFVVELRNAGLPVSLTENLDAMEAVQHIPIEDREAFKYALGATLIKNHAHWRSFETVFEVYFSLRGPEYKLVEGDDDTDIDELWRELQEQAKAEGQGAQGGMDNLTPEEIAQSTGWSRKATYKLKQTLNSEVQTCAEALGLDVLS